jgi:hypothetical protein
MIWSVSLFFSHGCKCPMQSGYVIEIPSIASKIELCACVRAVVHGGQHFDLASGLLD